jgi:hypothetical protein
MEHRAKAGPDWCAVFRTPAFKTWAEVDKEQKEKEKEKEKDKEKEKEKEPNVLKNTLNTLTRLERVRTMNVSTVSKK